MIPSKQTVPYRKCSHLGPLHVGAWEHDWWYDFRCDNWDSKWWPHILQKLLKYILYILTTKTEWIREHIWESDTRPVEIRNKFWHWRWWASSIWKILMEFSIFWNVRLLKYYCIFIFCSLSLRLANESNFLHKSLDRFSVGFRRLFEIYITPHFFKATYAER